jgi:hypothetical protein
MKKVVLFFFLFLSITLSCQTYVFTTYASYKTQRDDSSFEKNYIYNINDNNYHLTFRRGTYHIEARLHDEKSKMIHIFDLKENNDKIVTEFQYMHSLKMNYDFSDCFFEYQETTYQDSLTKINLTFFRTKKKKKIKQTYEFIGEKSKYNHFLFFRKNFFHGYSSAKNLLLSDDYIVTKYGAGEHSTTLSELKEINLTLTIDKIVFK